MTSYQLLEFYEQLFSKLYNLEKSIRDIKLLIDKITPYENELLQLIYTHGVNSINNDIKNSMNKSRNNIVNYVNEFMKKFDLLENHKIFTSTEIEINNYISDNSELFRTEIESIENLFNHLSSVYENLLKYSISKNNSNLVLLIENMKSVHNAYVNILDSYRAINDYIEKTEAKIDEIKGYKTLELQFYNEADSIYDYINYLAPMNECYEKICNLFNVSPTQYPLKVIKVESGSWFQKLFGAEKVMEALAYLITKVVDYVYYTFTKEGQIASQKQLFDLLLTDAQLISKYKDLGFDIDIDEEEVKKTHFMAIKSVQKMICKTSKLKVNGDIFSIDKAFEQQYLLESRKLIIENKLSINNELEENNFLNSKN
ncbi:hypothetical protein [Paramaledivibacter caminithermalis]|jgi:DNA-binding CsgD family transcriptional regulator|uniref:Uncharacterized protein n=1 Tax=Paramaledivibacter caminithermalis (strain DSM 15212 / CIP 107654 / DViRD3) TaxID=1121301 RepID=A0A1M6K4X8_PARC5|nr:hypothetical protein [Paramaledivibacter caminithermalis]SHJ53971.1 hypothetical protein SAMN02745912_00262 [Paramaledivibacter caminithermalis DSM 15212]